VEGEVANEEVKEKAKQREDLGMATGENKSGTR
jgi:hypothetical protein